MEKISCEVIRDLLPLYCDDVCSEDSRSLIEMHLEGCPECRTLLRKMRAECGIRCEAEMRDEEVVKDIASEWTRSVMKGFFKGVLAAVCVVLILAGAYWGLTRVVMVAVASKDVEVVVEAVTEQHIKIKLTVSDGKTVFTVEEKVTEDGKCYIIPKRGVLATQNGNGEHWSADISMPRTKKAENGSQVRIREIYCGAEGDSRLIWEEAARP